MIQPGQHQPVGNDRNRADRERGDNQGRRESNRRMTTESGGSPPGGARAKHEGLAMCDIDDAHDAEDNTEANGGQ